MVNKNQGNLHISLQYGFTLIELMIVIAIIGILATFAILQSERYTTRAQLNRAYYELRSTTTAIETVLAFGHQPTLDKNQDHQTINGITYEYVGLDNQRSTSNLLSHATLQTEGHNFRSISAQFEGHSNPALAGISLTLTRSNSGTWSCQIRPQSNAARQNIKLDVGDCAIITS